MRHCVNAFLFLILLCSLSLIFLHVPKKTNSLSGKHPIVPEHSLSLLIACVLSIPRYKYGPQVKFSWISREPHFSCQAQVLVRSGKLFSGKGPKLTSNLPPTVNFWEVKISEIFQVLVQELFHNSKEGPKLKKSKCTQHHKIWFISLIICPMTLFPMSINSSWSL